MFNHSGEGPLNIVVDATLKEMIKTVIHPGALEGPCVEHVKEAVKAQSAEEQKIKQRHQCILKYLKNFQADKE